MLHSENHKNAYGDSFNTGFEQLFKSQYARLVYYAAQIIDNKEAAEDIVQNVFMMLWAGGKVFPNDKACKSFLYTSVRNACLNWMRHARVEEKYLQEQEAEPLDSVQALNAIIKAEVVGEIFKALEGLPEGCRKIFKMSYLRELKNQEIADKLNISVNTVKTQKARALQLLRIKLKDHFALLLILPLLKIFQIDF